MRKPLQKNDILSLPMGDKERNFRITRILGDGASSIVYAATYQDGAGYAHDVIIKECYPFGANIDRRDNVLVWKDENTRNEAFRKFSDAYRLLTQIQRTGKLRNSTAYTYDLIEANGTLYSIQMLNEGCSYDKEPGRGLKSALQTALALAKLIAAYHEQGLLHLDIKPENFLVIPETRELVVLFDVDSVTSIQDLKDGVVTAVSYSEGWGAPEQLSGDPVQLCPATDLFSIGAVLFSKVMGRKVTAEDMSLFSAWKFDEVLPSDTNPKAVRILKEIFRKTLCASVKRRYQTAEELIVVLEEAINAADEKTYILSNCPPALSKFIGREEELAAIRKNFESGARAVFLHGFGGMGKTELAKKYAERYEDAYDACVFRMYDENSGLKGYFERIPVANDEEGAQEQDKIKQLRSLMKNTHALLIVDNFDVDDDDLLDDLLSLPADILITTRNNFSELVSNEKTRVVELDTLPVVDLVRLFIREYGVLTDTDEIEAAKEIIDYTDRWTMAIPIVARQIAASGGTVRAYADQMAADGFASCGKDSEEIRIRYRGKTLRKNSLDILRYVFDMGSLSNTEVATLRNLYVLRRHKALTKEVYRYYTGIKNLSALNHIVFLNWVRYDETNGILSIHQMVEDLIGHDLTIDPETVPEIYAYIERQFVNLDDCSNVSTAKTITFALLMLSYFNLSPEEIRTLYMHLGNFVDRMFGDNFFEIYNLLFAASEESTWHMLFDGLMDTIRSALPVETDDYEAERSKIFSFCWRWVIKASYQLHYRNEVEIPIVAMLGELPEEPTEEAVSEYLDFQSSMLAIYERICRRPMFDQTGVSCVKRYGELALASYPQYYNYYKSLLEACRKTIKVATDYSEVELVEKLVKQANEMIMEIESSLGDFCFHGLNREQVLGYRLLTEDEYSEAHQKYKAMHWTKKAAGWYESLIRWLQHCPDPYLIYRMMLSAEYGISKANAAQLVKKGFASYILNDRRLTPQQLQELLYCHCPEQIYKLRKKHSRRYYSGKNFGNKCRSMLTVFAQLLSGAELYLEYHQGQASFEGRAKLYRAAFIIKRSIGVQVFDPEPHILEEIHCLSQINKEQDDKLPEIIDWLLILADWTRTAGHLKQSQRMKHAILDYCLGLEYESLPEATVQFILYRVELLARNYKRQDVVDVLQKQRAKGSARRSFYVDLLDTSLLTVSQKRREVSSLAKELLWEVCSQYHDRIAKQEEPDITVEYIAWREVYAEVYPKLANIFSNGWPEWWDLCAQMTISENASQTWGDEFYNKCLSALRFQIYHRDLGVCFDDVGIDGLVYLFVEQADRNILKNHLAEFISELKAATWSVGDRYPTIVSNICRIRPEAKAFLPPPE